ncbi:MAG: hypothetical protein AB1523_14625 [Bacillota bacterium]
MEKLEKENLTEVLLSLQQEVHAHLRDTDQKREHLFELYLKIILSAFSAFVGLEFFKLEWPSGAVALALLILILLFAFGEAVFFAMVAARKWHVEYMNVHIIIQSMLVQQSSEVSAGIVSPELRQPFLPSTFTNRYFLLVQICVVGTVMVIITLLSKVMTTPLVFVLGSVLIIAVLLVNNVVARTLLEKAEQDFWEHPERSWCLSGLLAKVQK